MDDPVNIENVGAQRQENEDAEFKLILPKRKKRKRKPNQELKESGDIGLYSYMFLLNRLYESIKKDNPDKINKDKKIKIPLPIVQNTRVKTYISNFNQICTSINRDINHMAKFIGVELSCLYGTNKKGEIIIHGRFNVNQLTNIISQYIKTYVKCPNCFSLYTIINKDPIMRLHILKCNKCTSTRTIR